MSHHIDFCLSLSHPKYHSNNNNRNNIRRRDPNNTHPIQNPFPIMAGQRLHIVLEVLLAILLPPLGVCLRTGCCSCEFFICLILTLLGYVPGIIYAIYVIVVKNDGDQAMGSEYRALPE